MSHNHESNGELSIRNESPQQALEAIGCHLTNGIRYIERCRNLHSRFPDEVEADFERATREMLDAAMAARNLRVALDDDTSSPFPSAPASRVDQTHVATGDATTTNEGEVHLGTESSPTGQPTPEERLLIQIVQEALIDVCLRGGGTYGRLEVVRGDGVLRLTVEDGNVLGTDVSRTLDSCGSNSADIPGLRARTAILGGQLNAQSCEGRGLRITARVPLSHLLTRVEAC